MTLIEHGLLVDGTGAPAAAGDMLIDGDRIAALGAPGFAAALTDCERIDASGCLVTPGFIDAHAHSDTYLLIEPDAPSKLAQGVTTEINGQCGGSAVPRLGEARLSSDWASMSYPKPGPKGSRTLSETPGPTWRSLADYRALFEQVGPSVNTVQFVGHNTLRASVIGYAAVAATPDTQRAMENLLARELDDGGWGLTTGLIYQPGKYSDAAEVTGLARVAAAHGGLYATHMRSEGDAIEAAIQEVLDLVRATGIRAEISHLKTSGPKNWSKIDAVLDTLDAAVADGRLLGSDRYPYCAAGTDLDVVFPDWAGEGGVTAEIARLADNATAARIAAEIDASDRDWSGVMIGGTWCDATRPASGRTVANILRDGALLRALGLPDRTSPGALVCAILKHDACRTGGFFFGMCEENLHKICSRPWIAPGSDASLRAPTGPLGADHPHPRAYGTMPRFFRLLTGCVDGHARICAREEAIRRMTSLPARRFGLKNRGELRQGAFADIAVWNENEFRDTATYTQPHAFASGMKVVFVNGRLAYDNGRFTHAPCGRFLTRG